MHTPHCKKPNVLILLIDFLPLLIHADQEVAQYEHHEGVLKHILQIFMHLSSHTFSWKLCSTALSVIIQ